MFNLNQNGFSFLRLLLKSILVLLLFAAFLIFVNPVHTNAGALQDTDQIFKDISGGKLNAGAQEWIKENTSEEDYEWMKEYFGEDNANKFYNNEYIQSGKAGSPVINELLGTGVDVVVGTYGGLGGNTPSLGEVIELSWWQKAALGIKDIYGAAKNIFRVFGPAKTDKSAQPSDLSGQISNTIPDKQVAAKPVTETKQKENQQPSATQQPSPTTQKRTINLRHEVGCDRNSLDGSPDPFVLLNWDVGYENMTSQIIYRDNEVMFNNPPSVGPSYHDGTVKAGETYSYIIKAEYKDGYSNSAEVSIVVPVDICPLHTPTNAYAVGGTGHIVILWDGDGFIVEKKTGTNGTYSEATSTKTSIASYIDYVVSVGMEYCYRVRTYNRAAQSPYSNEVCATAIQPVDMNDPSAFRLNIPVNTRGMESVVFLQWGEISSSSLDNITPSITVVGSSDSYVYIPMTTNFIGMTQNAPDDFFREAYYFRTVVVNADGMVSYGPVNTFGFGSKTEKVP